MRTHNTLISRGNVIERTLIDIGAASDSIFSVDQHTISAKELDSSDHTQQQEEEVTTCSQSHSFDTILTFVEDSLVGILDASGESSNTLVQDGQSHAANLPTLQGVASSGKEDALDEKQYIGYEVLCCSFLLNIVLNGAAGTGSSLDEYLSITLECECTAKKTELIKLLKAKGAQEQLIMLLSGATAVERALR